MPGGWRRLGLATLAGLFITMAAACGYYPISVVFAAVALFWSWHDITRYTTKVTRKEKCGYKRPYRLSPTGRENPRSPGN